MPIKPHYLDASAAIKLVVKEPGSETISRYFQDGGPFYMTNVCFAETLGCLKVKYLYRKEITQEQYFRSCRLLLQYIREGRIHIEELGLTDRKVFNQIELLAKKYRLDLSDALQLVTVKQGRLRVFVDESRTLFITADKALASAARKEGLRVWNCMKKS